MVRFQGAGCSCPMRSVVFIAIVIWASIFVYLSISLYAVQLEGKNAEGEGSLASNYERALLDLVKLKRENDWLRKLVNDEGELSEKKTTIKNLEENVASRKLRKNFERQSIAGEWRNEASDVSQRGFSMEHEIARRALHNSIWEVYYYLDSHFKMGHNRSFVNHARNQILSLLGQSTAFGNVDFADSWRKNALAKISAVFQNYFDQMQNPKNCMDARILTCDLNKYCGFGCQLHHVTYCFIVAYGSNRTLILTNNGRTWRYAANGWTTAFLPITKCSFSEILKSGEEVEDWAVGKGHTNRRILRLPFVDSLVHRPPYLPLAIPQSWSDELLKLHSNPPVFFISQFMRYLMRPSAMFAKHIAQAVKNIPFDQGPIVGLQIRRTDKVGTEAAFHSIDEYMKWTEDWFRIEEYRTRSPVKRRIYIATDDPSVFNDVAVK